jgi:hypothetical protein
MLLSYIALSFDSSYASRGVNYVQKSLMILATGINFIKRFLVKANEQCIY